MGCHWGYFITLQHVSSTESRPAAVHTPCWGISIASATPFPPFFLVNGWPGRWIGERPAGLLRYNQIGCYLMAMYRQVYPVRPVRTLVDGVCSRSIVSRHSTQFLRLRRDCIFHLTLVAVSGGGVIVFVRSTSGSCCVRLAFTHLSCSILLTAGRDRAFYISSTGIYGPVCRCSWL